jgi:hypothetical protein
MRTFRIRLTLGDILDTPCDVLVVKHAQALYGADRAVVEALISGGAQVPRLPGPGEFAAVPAAGALRARTILFVGTPPLSDFEYAEIRELGRAAIQAVARHQPRASTLALTLHGPGFGLDERESLASEVGGLLDGVRGNNSPPNLKEILIVERDAGRVGRLQGDLDRLLATEMERIDELDQPTRPAAADPGGIPAETKPRVFVAMPFAESMDDVYHYGIQNAAHNAGYLCERADDSAFTGEILERVKQRIRTADLVVADLSTANPNVYLEVGFAWGVGKPTVLIVSNTDELKFDVRGQRCLKYSKIRELEECLTRELSSLRDARAASCSG